MASSKPIFESAWSFEHDRLLAPGYASNAATPSAALELKPPYWQEFANADAVNIAMVRLHNAVLDRELAWVNSHPRNARLRKVAMVLGNLTEEHADDVCYDVPADLLTTSGKLPLVCRHGLTLAWMAYASEASAILDALDGTNGTVGESLPARACSPDAEVVR